MEITVNINNNILIFNEWINTNNNLWISNNNSLWYRDIKSINGLIDRKYLIDQAIILIGFNDDSSISLRWHGSLIYPIQQIYRKLYFNTPKYFQMEEYKQHIDKFLNQIDKLKVFV